MRTKVIRIHWSDPLPIDQAIQSASGKIGLYYITRCFNGKEKSSYIGKSDSSIKSRLYDHERNWVHNYSHSKIFVRFGKIIYPRFVTETIIDHAEKALIYEHGQYGTKVLVDNTQYTNSYHYQEIFKIINEGNHFDLKPEVDMNNHEEYVF